jgi:hypothetical protein
VQLRSLDLVGFRRFRNASVRLEEPVVALIGRNEAGKSSVLEALSLLNGDDAIPPDALSGADSDQWRDVIRVRFRLSQDERAEVHGKTGHSPPWLRIAKPAAGPRTFYVDPPIPRLREAREEAATVLKSALDEPAFLGSLGTEVDGELRSIIAHVEGGDDHLGDEVRRLLSKTIDSAERVADSGGSTDQRRLRELSEVVQKAIDEDGALTSQEAGNLFRDRVPRFLEFTEEVRDLRSSYDPTSGQSYPALDNILNAVDITASQLFGAIQADDASTLANITRRFERVMDTLLRGGWTPGEHISIRLQVTDKTRLGLVVSTGEGDFKTMKQRSDGLRSFVALRTFVASQKLAVPPVLLVDEAERHLHYDAQGDLIRMFENQREAAGVIYSTHSAGCLPQDIGRGVRSVIPVGADASMIELAWTANDVGIMPLLQRMGAATALLAPRRAIVIGEGPTEAAILPELVRQATGETHMPYQVVGSLSVATDEQMADIARTNVHVALILDGDKAGNDHVSAMEKLGFDTDQIVQFDPQYEIEDVVDLELFVEAVESLLLAWQSKKSKRPTFTSADVTTPGRLDSVVRYCEVWKVKPPGHLSIGEEIMRLFVERSMALIDASTDEGRPRIFDPAATDQLKRVHLGLVAGVRLDESALF